MIRRVLPLGLAALVLAPAGVAGAADPLARCVEQAVEVLREEGASPMGEPTVRFMVEGESHNEAIELEDRTCIGVLAVGREGVRDVDLTLYTDSGIALERDVSISPYAWVRFCGAEGLRLVTSVRMYKGRGEVRILRVADAPRRLPDLNGLVGACFAAGTGVQRPGAEVGPEPPGPSVDDELERVDRRLRRLGWTPRQQLERGALRNRQRARRRVRLEAGRCYALAAVGGPRVRDVDLVVASPRGRPVARDVERKRNAVAKTCTRDAGVHVVEVRMYEGEGPWGLRLYELDEPPAGRRPPGLEGRTRIPYVETGARMRERGMRVRPFAWGYGAPGVSLAVPVRLEAGRCYAFGGVTSEDMAQGDLDLVLLDDGGGRIAWDLGRGSEPLLYACPSRTAVYHVRGRVYGARGRWLLLAGESDGGRR